LALSCIHSLTVLHTGNGQSVILTVCQSVSLPACQHFLLITELRTPKYRHKQVHVEEDLCKAVQKPLARFTDSEISLPYSIQPVTGPPHEPEKSSPSPRNVSLISFIWYET